MFSKILRISVSFVFLLAFGWVSGQLFFEEETDNLMVSVQDLFSTKIELQQIDEIHVMYPFVPSSFEPTLTDPLVWQWLVNTYEPLVKPDRDFKMTSALALSWGLVDPLTWEFKLRPDVTFHDGSKFSAEDVIASLGRANDLPISQISSFLSSIEEIKMLDDLRIQIKTKSPDPILLQRLSMLLIVPSEMSGKVGNNPIGTGPYKFNNLKEGILELSRFNEYWGGATKFENVILIGEINKSDRVNRFIAGDADFLVSVPFDAVEALEEFEFNVVEIPSLEVQFLVFNVNTKFMSNLKNRQAISLSVDRDALVESLGEYSTVVKQYVSNGVFGFSPEISQAKFDLEEAKKILAATNSQNATLKFHLPKGLDLLGELLRTRLNKIGLNLVVSYLDNEKLFESLEKKDADIYFLGFKEDLGDSLNFLTSMVKSDGSFNVGGYKNKIVDGLIEKSEVEMDQLKRLKLMQESMKMITEVDLFGVPLFEYETLYAFDDRFDFQPRIDGFFYFDDLIIK